MSSTIKNLPGLVLTIVIAIIAYLVSKTSMNAHLHVSSLLYAIIFGMILTNVTKIKNVKKFQGGIAFSSKPVLRLGVILLGFKLSVTTVMGLGWEGVIYIFALSTCSILFVRKVAKWIGLDESMGNSLAVGTSICGASAIAAIGPMFRAKEQDTAFGIGAITLFGTIAMFVFPVIFHAFDLDPTRYGFWVGATLPEVAEVVAAGGAVGHVDAEAMAITAKLTRVLFLVPVSLFYVYISMKNVKAGKNATAASTKVQIPWYVVFFIIVVCINSFAGLDATLVSHMNDIGAFILTIAMAALGLKTDLGEMRKAGPKPIYCGLLGACFIQLFGFLGAMMIF